MLDSVPIAEAIERADARSAHVWWHRFLFASDQAERVITAGPTVWCGPDAAIMGHELRGRPGGD